MKLIVLITLLGTIVSCGQQVKVNKRFSLPKTDEVFSTYLETYSDNYAQTYGQAPSLHNIHIVFAEFSKEDSQYAGICYTIENQVARLIEINPEHWAKYSEAKRESLIFHELGHCHLNLKHVNEHRTYFDQTDDSRVSNIMYPYINSNWGISHEVVDEEKRDLALEMLFDLDLNPEDSVFISYFEYYNLPVPVSNIGVMNALMINEEDDCERDIENSLNSYEIEEDTYTHEHETEGDSHGIES
jgi:hypothetical protein